MKKSTIFQSSVSEPDKTEDWESLPVENKDKIIRSQSRWIIFLLCVIVFMAFRLYQ